MYIAVPWINENEMKYNMIVWSFLNGVGLERCPRGLRGSAPRAPLASYEMKPQQEACSLDRSWAFITCVYTWSQWGMGKGSPPPYLLGTFINICMVHWNGVSICPNLTTLGLTQTRAPRGLYIWSVWPMTPRRAKVGGRKSVHANKELHTCTRGICIWFANFYFSWGTGIQIDSTSLKNSLIAYLK